MHRCLTATIARPCKQLQTNSLRCIYHLAFYDKARRRLIRLGAVSGAKDGEGDACLKGGVGVIGVVTEGGDIALLTIVQTIQAHSINICDYSREYPD